MTDGIIQKVFNKYIDRTTPKTPPFDTLTRIENELVEKIKQNAEGYNFPYGGIERIISVKDLIGDGKK